MGMGGWCGGVAFRIKETFTLLFTMGRLLKTITPIKNILVQFLVDKEIFDSSALSLVLILQTGLQI